jgi:hypothetical protein
LGGAHNTKTGIKKVAKTTEIDHLEHQYERLCTREERELLYSSAPISIEPFFVFGCLASQNHAASVVWIRSFYGVRHREWAGLLGVLQWLLPVSSHARSKTLGCRHAMRHEERMPLLLANGLIVNSLPRLC